MIAGGLLLRGRVYTLCFCKYKSRIFGSFKNRRETAENHVCFNFNGHELAFSARFCRVWIKKEIMQSRKTARQNHSSAPFFCKLCFIVENAHKRNNLNNLTKTSGELARKMNFDRHRRPSEGKPKMHQQWKFSTDKFHRLFKVPRVVFSYFYLELGNWIVGRWLVHIEIQWNNEIVSRFGALYLWIYE